MGARAAEEAELPELASCLRVAMDQSVDLVNVDLARAVTVDRLLRDMLGLPPDSGARRRESVVGGGDSDNSGTVARTVARVVRTSGFGLATRAWLEDKRLPEPRALVRFRPGALLAQLDVHVCVNERGRGGPRRSAPSRRSASASAACPGDPPLLTGGTSAS
jgi:hypothetical protein